MKEEIKELLRKNKKPVFLGLGNIMRGDDGVGVFVANKIKEDYDVIIGEKNPEKHLKEIKEKTPDLLFIIDSVDHNSSPGSVIFSDASEINKRHMSSHRMPIPIFVKLLKEKLPDLETYLIGIQPKEIDIKEKLSKEVKESAKSIIKILKEINT